MDEESRAMMMCNDAHQKAASLPTYIRMFLPTGCVLSTRWKKACVLVRTTSIDSNQMFLGSRVNYDTERLEKAQYIFYTF